MVLKNTLAF